MLARSRKDKQRFVVSEILFSRTKKSFPVDDSNEKFHQTQSQARIGYLLALGACILVDMWLGCIYLLLVPTHTMHWFLSAFSVMPLVSVVKFGRTLKPRKVCAYLSTALFKFIKSSSMK